MSKNIEVLRQRVAGAEKHGVPVLVVATVELRELLDDYDKKTYAPTAG